MSIERDMDLEREKTWAGCSCCDPALVKTHELFPSENDVAVLRDDIIHMGGYISPAQGRSALQAVAKCREARNSPMSAFRDVDPNEED